MPTIHPTALIDSRAELADGVTVGPFTVIGPQVRIGEGTSVGSHCTIDGPTTIGRDNRIHAHAALGGAPQDMKYRGEPTELVIGDRNTIREYVTFNRGTVQDKGVTRIGDDNWVMAYVHLAHDVQVGNRTIFANYSACAGHVVVGDWAIVGGQSGIHQFCKVGAHAMLGFQSHVSQDVPPYMTVSGNPLAVHGINAEGLRRRGFDADRIAAVKQMHRLLYRSSLTFEQSRAAIDELAQSTPAAVDDIALMRDFLAAATRGIVR